MSESTFQKIADAGAFNGLTAAGERRVGKWTPDDDAWLRAKHGTMSIERLAETLGRSRGSVRGRITRLKLCKQVYWTAAEVSELMALYKAAEGGKVLNLTAFAKKIGRDKANVCRKAKELGLTTDPHRKTVEQRKDRPKYATVEERRAAQSAARRQWFRDNPHPRGMAGKHHSEKTRKRLSAASRAANLFIYEDEKQARTLKAMKTKAERYGAVGIPVRGRGSWKAGWREIGGKRDFYRSRWEANYARYLQWLKERGEISDWQHEPETFWFEQIKRGTRSYLPDFRVWENDGRTVLHEVKGWMDQRSRTTLARMKKYHPQEKIILIDGAQYRAIRLKVMRLVEGWEDSARDTHA